MHRSPLYVLVLGAALAACSTRDDPRSGELLSHDSTLVARLDAGRDAAQAPLPEACRTLAGATPTVVNRAQADTLGRRASDAEILGNVKEARTLLRRAMELDGTNKTTAYHLGRTSEALGDRATAITAYCRYLTLSPTPAESDEARQRVVSLSQTETHPAVASVATKPIATQQVATRTASTPSASAQSATAQHRTLSHRATSSARVAERRQAVRVANAGETARRTDVARATTTTVEQVGTPADSASAGGEVVATAPAEPSPTQRPDDSRAASRGPGRAQSAGIGAAAGAIIGAATGRSVRGTVIGAAAGGILGGVIGGGH